jgi:hypothetical protein
MQVFIHFVHILGFFYIKKYTAINSIFNCQIQINQNGATSFKALKHPLKKSTVIIHYKFLSLVKYLSIKLLLFKKKYIDLDILSYSQKIQFFLKELYWVYYTI